MLQNHTNTKYSLHSERPHPSAALLLPKVSTTTRSLMSQARYKAQSGSSKADTTAPKSLQLLFINKDPTNLSRTPEEIYAVGSHVSRGSRKWKRTKSSLELDSSTGKILAAAGLDSENVSRMPSPSTGKPMTLRWRMEDGKVTSTKTIEDRDNAKARARAVKSATASPSSTPLTPSTMPSTPAPNEDHGRSITTLLQFYFEVIRPFALSISRAWIWADEQSLVLSSPALTYAICALSSAFSRAAQHGLHSLVLPPEPAEGQEPLWPVPEWFVFQTQSISLLRRHLANTTDSQRPIQKAELHAMLFLMRLEVFLGDREAALLHLNAIKMATQDAAILPDLNIDMAMWKINLMIAFTNQSTLVMRPYVRAEDPARQTSLLGMDYSQVVNPIQRRRMLAHGLNRTILWRPDSPQTIDPATDPPGLVEDFMANDTGIYQLSFDTQQELKICLQICRFLLCYLRYINADTTREDIRTLVLDLQRRLTNLTRGRIAAQLWRSAPRSMFYIAFTGAFASRECDSRRNWFAQQINQRVAPGATDSFDDLKNILSMYLDPNTVYEPLLREVWDLIRERQGTR